MEKKIEKIEVKLDPKVQELYARLEEEREENARLTDALNQLKTEKAKEKEINSRKVAQQTKKKLALQEQLLEKKLQEEIIDSKQSRIDGLRESLNDQQEIHSLDSKSLNELKATLDTLITSRNKRIELINKLTEKNHALMQDNENLKFTRTAFAHDLRSLMSSILGTITLIDLGEKEVAKNLLPALEERCHIFINLLDTINSNQISKETFNIDGITRILNLDIEDSEKKIKTEVSGDDIQLSADRAALYDVIQNLINNTIKYCGIDPQKLIIKIDVSQDENDTIIQVTDNGVGIPADKQKNIFDLYDRAGIKDNRGKGIGLYMVRKMIENHGGTIAYDSNYQKGAQFIIKLPPV
ncbi:MAG: GHKL domain-containing protein [Deltaproteobacteria bacterium]|nr:GHKL domain-containing protein [Deltaproteobacteria bacterium]MBT4091205.1 GHKL domain-containing protein [Deltaproteobacteria bacterium]MBT4264517.1 GHKL domain-containing protein [Deltaproteobacteria bacterium]MBT4638502.1 GHKL domain-containing protein [Deltaproteobacteria bacterium]MBT6500287.1 GHKL domain-containing protein [Deltaproteobacteria bacterium]